MHNPPSNHELIYWQIAYGWESQCISMGRAGRKSFSFFRALPIDWSEMRVTQSVCPEPA
jgi:hypothetical protein